jgi:VWFA-related protein
MQTDKKAYSWSLMLIVLVAVMAVAKSVAPQSGGGAIPAAAVVAASSPCPEVDLNVVVLDKQGVPQKVDEREFQLFENGVERPLQFRGSPDSPVSLALMIDSSGSIFKRKDAMIAAAKAIVNALPNDSEVMAVLFADKAYLDLPFTVASKVDFSFLDRLQASGPTGLYDAVVATEGHVVAHAKYTRRALVILSDGEDNASRVPRGVAFRKMEQPGAPMVYACVLSRANILQRDLMVGHINMKFLAKWGGGIEFNLDPDPESAAAQIASAVRGQYVLQFTTPDPARNGKGRKIAMRLPAKDVQLHVLPGYFAPAK